MTQQAPARQSAPLPRSPRLREVAASIFRQRRTAGITFLTLFLASILALALRPRVYEVQMKFLVNRERVDPVLSATADSTGPRSAEVSDTELNSEVELLRSRDLLERVVRACNLHWSPGQDGWPTYLSGFGVGEARGEFVSASDVASATKELDRRLSVQRIKMTNLIKVTYRSRDPRLAAVVLGKMADLYLEKHLAVHRPAGAFAFFQQQTRRIGEELQNAQASLTDFTRQAGVVSARQEKEFALTRRSEFDAQLQAEQASIAQARRRLASLEAQLASIPPRTTTAVRVSNSSAHLDALKTTLAGLELKHTELLGKFDASYHTVQEVARQIAQTRDAIQEAESLPDREETSDRNPTHEWLQSELARTRAELSALQGRAAAIATSVRTYAERARLLEEQQAEQEERERRVKAAEENLLLYSRKQEEARISDALDRERILNVAISEAPAVPLLPAGPAWSVLLLFAFLISAALAMTAARLADRMDPRLHSADQVLASLEVPVLAAIPKGVV